ncbi:SRPBCC family protein [Amycolatopsis sacchari]|uniref:Polyketide cyclase / dehydrase and lipid transport n=1 Tax=Amycolatopsis sacchari TaxID=115433 RepID=A0A1I3V0S9_9PSEU|nr:SRPBCC family protein [Amycolatopsis sacchari]SFJ89274.1 hypothetical protein SAMN05421835_11095 [Amycolatopsis sacchari]
MTTLPSRTLSIRIERPCDEVYNFLTEPGSSAKWASGMDSSAPVTSAEVNEFGVLDHTVHLPGQDVYVPMRVVRNGTGSEVLFTLFRLPDMDDAQYAADAEAVMKDLRKLKELLEN